MIIGWLLYLSIALKIGWGIFSARGLEPLNLGILRFFTALENMEFRSSASSLSSLISFCYSLLVLFSHLILIWEKVMVWKVSKIVLCIISHKTVMQNMKAKNISIGSNIAVNFIETWRIVIAHLLRLSFQESCFHITLFQYW